MTNQNIAFSRGSDQFCHPILGRTPSSQKWTETDGIPGYSRQTKPPRDQPSKETKETWQLQKTEPSQDSKLSFSKGAQTNSDAQAVTMHHASFGWFFTCWIAGLNQASGALTLESAKPAIQKRSGSRALSKTPGTQRDLWDVGTTSTTNLVLSWSRHGPNPRSTIHHPVDPVANSVGQLVQ